MCMAFLRPPRAPRIGNRCPSCRPGCLGWDHWRDGPGPARARRHARRIDRRRRGRRRRARVGRARRRRGRDRQDQPGAGLRGRRAAARACCSAACDDLLAPRPLGPLRDAALSGGPLAAAFAPAGPSTTCSPRCSRSSRPTPPTALVVEDVHWADDATLDVLGYAARRIEPLPAVLVLTFRDDELDARTRCGACSARWRAPRPAADAAAALPAAVERLAGGQRAPTPTRCTRSPAATRSSSPRCWPRPPDAVPGDASSTRCSPASAAWTRPAATRSSSSRSCPRRSARARRRRCSATGSSAGRGRGAPGVVVGGAARHLGFRHELARRAIEQQPAGAAPPALNAPVVRALRSGPRTRPRAAHAPRRRGRRRRDVLAVGPGAAREAAPRPARIARRSPTSRRCARTLDAARPSASARRCSTTTAGSSTTRTASADAVAAGRGGRRASRGSATAVAARPCASCGSSRHLFMAGDTGEAERLRRAGGRDARGAGDAPALADALAAPRRHPRHDRRAGRGGGCSDGAARRAGRRRAPTWRRCA